jgi:SNF2 family DNA or RNA helicase
MTTLVIKGDRMMLRSKRVPACLQSYERRDDPGSHSFPVCGDIVRRLIDFDPNMDITDGTWARLSEAAVAQEPAMMIAEAQDWEGDERLFPYQRVAVAWLRQVRRGILADEQGLGKTVMAVVAARECAPKNGLIICTTAMMRTWADHLREWIPDAAVYVLEGDQRAREETILKWIGRDAYLVTNYARAEIHQEFLLADLVIVDEAHHARNRKTKASDSLRRIARRAEWLFLLTASPTVNNLPDLWPLLSMCDPKRFGSYWGFVFRFCNVSDNGFGLKIEGLRESESGALDRILKPYVLRREGVLGLRPSEYRIVDYRLPPEQRRLYDEMAATGTCRHNGSEVEALDVLAQITRLRQIALDPALVFGHRHYDEASKLDLLPELIREREGQVVIFTNYAQLANRAVERLAKTGISATVMTGELSAKQREYSLSLFRSGAARVMVLTHGTGGEGLQLVEADRAIFLDLAWHPAGNTHAARRINRHGQTSDKTQIILIRSVGTIEGHVWDIISEKRPVTIGEILRREPALRLTTRGGSD